MRFSDTEAEDENGHAEAEREPPASSRNTRALRQRPSSPRPPVGFDFIVLEPWPGAQLSGPPGAPPPTLPRDFAELQPAPSAPARALFDYDGEYIGSLDDFRATRPLQVPAYLASSDLLLLTKRTFRLSPE